MTEKDALAWGNEQLSKLGVSGMMKFVSGTHSGGEINVELLSGKHYPDYGEHGEGFLLDYEFADDFKTAVGRILLRVRVEFKDLHK